MGRSKAERSKIDYSSEKKQRLDHSSALLCDRSIVTQCNSDLDDLVCPTPFVRTEDIISVMSSSINNHRNEIDNIKTMMEEVRRIVEDFHPLAYLLGKHENLV
ncbi:unnamed protein product [Heterobilharzia americana]|nr:unnamed protein product [Heterobilharzia americana]CAH8560030.1 unnamed protein product [Heterobilharzia americana]